MNKECYDCGSELKYDEGTYYCENKNCGLFGKECDMECYNVIKEVKKLNKSIKKTK